MRKKSSKKIVEAAVSVVIATSLIMSCFVTGSFGNTLGKGTSLIIRSFVTNSFGDQLGNGPSITNINENPDPQKINGYVNISCNVNDPDGVDEVFLNIKDPNNNVQNFSIKENKTGNIYYCNQTYNIAGQYKYFIWANDTNGDATTSSIRSFSIVRWNVVLNVKESGGKNDTAIFGEVDDASDGKDNYDVPKPPSPGHPYIRSWFEAGLTPPYNELWADYRDYPDTLESWNLYIKTNITPPSIGDTNVTISWNTDDINSSEYGLIELWNESGFIKNMKINNNFSFNASFDTLYHFIIKCYTGPYSLTLTKSGTGQAYGTIEVNRSGPYYYGDVVTIWANVSAGATFDGFSGSLSGTDTPQGLTFNGDESVDAAFTLISYSLTLTKSGTGDGTVEASPAPPYYYDTVVTLWANASVGSTFTVWSGDLTGSDSPDTVTMDGPKSVDAEFTQGYGIHLNSNWNLISIPFNESINKTDIVVSYGGTNYSWNAAGSIVLNFIYGWNRTNQNYETIDILDPGYGYWVWAYYDCELLVSGNITSDGNITALKQKWNIIGLPYNTSVAKENLIINYSGADYTWQQATTGPDPIILGFIYGWGRNTQNYILSDDLDPGYGYWMYAYHDCTLKK